VLEAVGLVVEAVGALVVVEGPGVVGASAEDIDISALRYAGFCGNNTHHPCRLFSGRSSCTVRGRCSRLFSNWGSIAEAGQRSQYRRGEVRDVQ
jgi:hypothetical protein